MSRLIVYGDVHGCLDELKLLRKKIGIKDSDIEVCAGDFITKGKKSVKLVKYLRKKHIKAVLGNHEDRLLRYIKHSKSIKRNPIKLDENQLKIVDSLSKKSIDYLESLPYFLRIGKYTIVHGGLQNKMNLENLSKRDKEKILRMRYLSGNGKFLIYGKEDKSSVFWADMYDGKNGFVLYGHNKFKEPKISEYAIGLDTGCVYGNKLSAVIIKKDKKRFESVKCIEQ